jgi:tripeptide aminopeptidase
MDLCRIPSPSGREGQVAAYIRTRAAALGLEVEEDSAGVVLGSDTGNLVLRVPGKGEPLFFCAHMDTVPTPAGLSEIPLVCEPDRIHTGGASILGYDDKGGVAAILELAEIAAEQKDVTLPLELVFTIQEELGLRGSRVFDTSRLKARSGFVLDSETRIGSGLAAQPSRIVFSIEVHGKAAHAAIAPEQGINAIKALGAVIHELPTGKIDEETVMNLGKVEGGGTINVVPDQAVLTGEIRSLNESTLQAMVDHVQRSAEGTAAAFNASVHFSAETMYTSYRIPSDARSVRLFVEACQTEGLETDFIQTLGGSDANNFNQKGLACLNVGMEMNHIHSVEEDMHPSRFILAVRVLERLIHA